tara:strand:+ start:3841 stop:4740 length:900 start_codon:yes stop_codon:yes gene_type:complete
MESWRKFLLSEEKNVAGMPFPEQQIIDKAYELIELAGPEVIKSSPVLNKIIFHDSPSDDNLGHYWDKTPRYILRWADYYFKDADSLKIGQIVASEYDSKLTGAQKKTDDTAFVNLSGFRTRWQSGDVLRGFKDDIVNQNKFSKKASPKQLTKDFKKIHKDITDEIDYHIAGQAMEVASTIVHEVAHAVEPREFDKFINQKVKEIFQKAIEAGLFDFDTDTQKITGVGPKDMKILYNQILSEVNPLVAAARSASEIYAYKAEIQFLKKLKTKWRSADIYNLDGQIQNAKAKIVQYSTNKK